ncbi:hypothetical protein R3P38DRAFT_2819168, partial [Favolaschia claudopus]
MRTLGFFVKFLFSISFSKTLTAQPLSPSRLSRHNDRISVSFLPTAFEYTYTFQVLQAAVVFLRHDAVFTASQQSPPRPPRFFLSMAAVTSA